MSTFREKYIKKYGRDAIGNVDKISKITKIPKSILLQVYNRGIGAAKTNPLSIRLKGSFIKNASAPRSMRLSNELWALARVYGYVMRNRRLIGKGQPDRDLYEKELKLKK